jgi:hypothetical protein
MAYSNGSVFRRVGSARKGHESIIAAGKLAGQKEVVFLVESAGVLLLVLGQWSNLKVFRVNVEQKALEPADNIGGRALFLGRRCLSVDANQFPNIEGNCLYYRTSFHEGVCTYSFRICQLDLSNVDTMDGLLERFSAGCPWSIARAFLTYCLNLQT